MPNPTVRVSPRAYRTLKDMSTRSGEPMQDILDRAIETEQRKRFFEEANASYARLKEDATAWNEFKDEMRSWDAALLDGLTNDVPDRPTKRRISRHRGQ